MCVLASFLGIISTRRNKRESHTTLQTHFITSNIRRWRFFDFDTPVYYYKGSQNNSHDSKNWLNVLLSQLCGPVENFLRMLWTFCKYLEHSSRSYLSIALKISTQRCVEKVVDTPFWQIGKKRTLEEPFALYFSSYRGVYFDLSRENCNTKTLTDLVC